MSGGRVFSPGERDELPSWQVCDPCKLYQHDLCTRPPCECPSWDHIEARVGFPCGCPSTGHRAPCWRAGR